MGVCVVIVESCAFILSLYIVQLLCVHVLVLFIKFSKPASVTGDLTSVVSESVNAWHRFKASEALLVSL